MDYSSYLVSKTIAKEKIINLLKANEEFLKNNINLINDHLYTNFKYHNKNHALKVGIFAFLLANFYNLDIASQKILLDAALLHDIGRVSDIYDDNHNYVSSLIASDILKNQEFYQNEEHLLLVKALIYGHNQNIFDQSIFTNNNLKAKGQNQLFLKILKDADTLDLFRFKTFYFNIQKLHLENSQKLIFFASNINQFFLKEDNMDDIIINIIQSINILLRQCRFILTKDDYITLKKIQLELKKITNYSYKDIRDIENKILPYFAKVWQTNLTNVNEYQEGMDFHFVVTSPTTSIAKYDFKNKEFISASYITDKHMGTFNKINYGLICDINKDNLLSIFPSDSNTLCDNNQGNISKKYFYTNTTTNGSKLYSKSYVSPLYLPNEIENLMIKENILANKDVIIQPNKSVYSDLTLDAQKTKMLGVFLLKPCSKSDEENANLLAEKFKLPMLTISKDIYLAKYSIIKKGNHKQYYDLQNLDTIEFLIKNYEACLNIYSNLIINIINDYVSLKDENGKIKITINKKTNKASIYLDNNNQYYEIDFNNTDNTYYIDNIKVTKKEFTEALQSLDISNKLK